MKLKKIYILIIMVFMSINTSVFTYAQNKYSINVNLTQNIVTIYELDENGEYTIPYKAFICSVGKNNSTPVGTFSTQNKYDWRALFGNVYGQYATRINGNILFHSVYYSKQDKSTLNTSSYNELGTSVSAGCVRMTVEGAKWIYDNCPLGTKVNIYKSDEPEPIIPEPTLELSLDDSKSGWDPTDPDINNPWIPYLKEEEEKVQEAIRLSEELKEIERLEAERLELERLEKLEIEQIYITEKINSNVDENFPVKEYDFDTTEKGFINTAVKFRIENTMNHIKEFIIEQTSYITSAITSILDFFS